MTPSRFCDSTNGSIIPRFVAMSLIHLSGIIGMTMAFQRRFGSPTVRPGRNLRCRWGVLLQQGRRLKHLARREVAERVTRRRRNLCLDRSGTLARMRFSFGPCSGPFASGDSPAARQPTALPALPPRPLPVRIGWVLWVCRSCLPTLSPAKAEMSRMSGAMPP